MRRWLMRLLEAIESIADSLKRIANFVVPLEADPEAVAKMKMRARRDDWRNRSA